MEVKTFEKVLCVVTIGIVSLVVGIIIGFSAKGPRSSSNEEFVIVYKTRNSMMDLNREYNRLFQVTMSNYVGGDMSYASTLACLRILSEKLIQVNRELKIDCFQYGSDGKKVLVEKDGELYPLEVVPDELIIINN